MTTIDWILLLSMPAMYAATIAVIETSAKRWDQAAPDERAMPSDGDAQARGLRTGMAEEARHQLA